MKPAVVLDADALHKDIRIAVKRLSAQGRRVLVEVRLACPLPTPGRRWVSLRGETEETTTYEVACPGLPAARVRLSHTRAATADELACIPYATAGIELAGTASDAKGPGTALPP